MFKKSQITLFLLLGMVMLVVFSFLFYTAHTVTKTRMEKRSEKIITDLLETTAFKYYVTTCLQDSTKKGLKIIGEQGGFFHKNQGSIIDWDIPYVEYSTDDKTYNVSYQVYSVTTPGGYGLKEPFKKIDIDFGHYPCYKGCKDVIRLIDCDPINPLCWPGTTDDECNKQVVDLLCHGLYNHMHSTLLSEAFGSKRDINKVELNLCKEKTSILRAGGEPYVCGELCSYNPQNIPSCIYSIQSQLEVFIANETKKCVDFSFFREYISELGYNITLGQVSANISFGVDDVGVKIDFPIIIRIKGYQPVIRLLNFYATEPVRLYKIINIAKELIKYDVTDVEFRIKENSPEFKGEKIINKEGYGGIDVDVIDLAGGNASVVIINDSSSRLGSQAHYVFVFARENRPPALDHIDDKYVVIPNILKFSPIAYDPDEDYLIYDYWPYGNYIVDNLTDSDIYKNPGVGECINGWTGESNALRCASYTTKDGDQGNYIIRVHVYDDEYSLTKDWSKDYQDVNVFISNVPDIDVDDYGNFFDYVDNAGNPLSNSMASIEDPYYILVKNTNIQPPGDRQYRWVDNPDQDFSYTWDEGVDKKEWPSLPYDITNLGDYLSTGNMGAHNIDISVRDGKFTINEETAPTINIQVEECLPHRSSAAPYPFNTYTGDNPLYPDEPNPFLANHTCCQDDFTRYGLGKECYHLEDYGCIDHFKSGSPYYDYFDNIGLPASVPAVPEDPTKVYKRTLKRWCSNSRGNICDGPSQHYVDEIPVATCPPDECCKHSLISEAFACEPCPP